MTERSTTPAGLAIRMRIGPREKVHKIFILHGSRQTREHGVGSEFRVLTKEKEDGTLELLGYTYRFDGVNEQQSDLLRAPSVPTERLLEVIKRLVEQTHTDIAQLEPIDLSAEPSRLDQADRLAQRDLLDAFIFE